MIDILVWFALMMSLGTGVGMVWSFSVLVNGSIIVGDKYNEVELIVATAILCLVVIALVVFTIRKIRR